FHTCTSKHILDIEFFLFLRNVYLMMAGVQICQQKIARNKHHPKKITLNGKQVVCTLERFSSRKDVER
ncbi:MAG: hypothetical protein K8S56_10955, partial [Candidatus Cloacimonetes bacterium]|nr:hypothetical protein [Candidatus Cloacimonadota bacterium]